MSTATSDPIQRLRRLGLDSKDFSTHKGLPRASVLVPLFLDETEKLRVLLNQRPLHLKSHPGEVCFPGGRQDDSDQGDDVVTALREADEEIGLKRENVQILCRLPTEESVGGLCVTPIVALLKSEEVLNDLAVSKDEVEDVFTVPLDYFLEQNGNLADKFDIPWSDGVFTVRSYPFRDELLQKEFNIWGLTAHIIHDVACVALEGQELSSRQIPEAASNTTVKKEGDLFIWKDKKYWKQQYFVLVNRMLHQYPSMEIATRKSASATKKNRLPLHEMQIENLTEFESKFPFEVKVLGGRVSWRLAAPSETLRKEWVEALKE